MVLNVHPEIRILGLIVLGAACATGRPEALATATALLGFATYVVRSVDFIAILTHLARLRWLLVSLAILYFWFTPGAPLFEVGSLQRFVPTWEGVVLGLQRIAALGLMLIGAQLVLQSTPRADLIKALHALAWPLALIPGLRERIALRLVLTMESLASVQSVVQHTRDTLRQTERGARMQVAEGVIGVFKRTLARADAAPLSEIAIERGAHAPAWQWLLLVVVIGAFIWL